MVPRWLGIDRMWVNRQVVVGEREISRRRYEPFSRVSHPVCQPGVPCYLLLYPCKLIVVSRYVSRFGKLHSTSGAVSPTLAARIAGFAINYEYDAEVT